MSHVDIDGTSYVYDDARLPDFEQLADRVRRLRAQGKLSPDVLHRIRKHFRIKNIYHSNAIEGNALAVGETRQVVEEGLTITGKPLKDQAEARNLSHALDFLEDLAGNRDRPIVESDVRQLHALVLDGITGEAGTYRSATVSISGSDYSPPGPESVYGNVYLKDFGNIEFEKYDALRRGESAKRTWFLRVDFRRRDTTARYLFFFGHASHAMRARCDVTLHVAREEPAGSFHYERLEHIKSPNVPDLAEVGYEMSKERFVVRMRNGRSRVSGVEEFTKSFFDAIVSKHFKA